MSQRNCSPNTFVFPTYVGMNRWIVKLLLKKYCIPHIRGDEPYVIREIETLEGVFPMHVGMNRT